MATKKTAKRVNLQSIALPLSDTALSDDASKDDARPDAPFPIVGIGASAGGLSAFEAFFSSIPNDEDPGMAFVLVQHLAPDHKSILTELIQRFTRMHVFEVKDGMQVQINCAYIIPPNYDMALLNGKLHLLEPTAPRGMRLSIDFFFRSLAESLRERAIGIVLSGTGSDGTLGIRAIKGEGGMVMAQTPDSTEFDGMPRSAIATGLVDYELPPAEMPAKLMVYTSHILGIKPRSGADHALKSDSALKKIFVLLRAVTGHDFSQYKPSTIHRRIDRRMAVHSIESIDDYVKYLQQTPSEVVALFRDMLIGVTNFFRDLEAFQTLEKLAIPKLFDNKPAGSVIRVWSVGCSTGEEAYSIAILLQEHIERLKQNYTVQVFATDIDSRAITTARAGIYPASIAADITPERLARYFSQEADGNAYRIQPVIRDMLIFSEQDLIKDPPFSKLDLISCRNLLIYISAELQRSIIPLFHFALKPDSILFLGTSEGIGDFGHLFAVMEQKSKLYERKEYYLGAQRGALTRFSPTLGTLGMTHEHDKTDSALQPTKLPLRELTEQALLRQTAPAGALINAQGDILYLHGKAGRYLELTAGVVGTNNILKMTREGLQHELALVLKNVTQTKSMAHSNGLRVSINGYITLVNLTVCAVQTKSASISDAYLYLVIFDDAPTVTTDQLRVVGAATSNDMQRTDVKKCEECIESLQQELRTKDEYLQSAQEKLEASLEELKSSNEEMQSVNEELQSANEELETSKEELQSVNEELATVNNELQTKVVDLSRANNDMNNLLAGTGIGTVFVDHQLQILRFTPAVSTIINLIASDVGRPITHIVSNFVGYDKLAAEIQGVLSTLIFKEVEVQTKDGNWYMMRIQAYRTLDNVIEGAVISFFNISETVQARDALHKANDLLRLAVVVRDAHDAITVLDMSGRILAWNPGATRIYGWNETEALQMNALDMMPQTLRKEALNILLQLSKAKVIKPYLTQRITKQAAVLEVSIVATALLNDDGVVYAISTTERAVEGDS